MYVIKPCSTIHMSHKCSCDYPISAAVPLIDGRPRSLLLPTQLQPLLHAAFLLSALNEASERPQTPLRRSLEKEISSAVTLTFG